LIVLPLDKGDDDLLTAKEYLSQVETLNTKIEQKRAELDMLRGILKNTPELDYSRERISGGHKSEAGFASAIEEIADIEREIVLDTAQLLKARRSIINSIQQLDIDKYVKILFKVYAEGKHIAIVAREMGYSYQYTRTLHAEALAYFEIFAKVPT
jgi:hypothetical protein